MHNFYDYKKFAILYVDDEQLSLKGFTRTFRDKFWILTAANAKEGSELLQQHGDDVALLLCDQQMPGEKGVQFLERARQLRPRILRFLVTAHSDFGAAIDAVNNGAIYKYVSKPWEVNHLEMTLRRAMEFYIVQRERDLLMKEKMSVLHNMMIADRVVSLGILAAGLGHHVRNSLVAVRTFLDLAPAKLQEEHVNLEELRNPNFWQEFYQHVQKQVLRITDMLLDLGAAAELSMPMFQDQVELPQAFDEVMEKLKPQFAAKNLKVEIAFSEGLPTLMVDGEKFRRLLQLLLMEELSQVPEGGQIWIRAKALPMPAELDPQIQIEIEDNGPGIHQDDLRSVFDPFFVRNDHPQEFGIKLMTCFFIVHHHGGRIEVSSTQGSGTRFLVTLPTRPQPQNSRDEDELFISKVLLNESLWEKLLSGN
jgi:two-component system, probable response regulator PhcQ